MKKSGKIWLTTDTHFGHSKMVDHCGRPENHSEIVLANLKNMVSPDDTLIHLGDVCWGRDDEWHRILDNWPHKMLCLGNHDKKSLGWYLKRWAWVGEFFMWSWWGETIWFSHRPLDFMKYHSGFNIHGHQHNTKKRPGPDDTPQHYLLALEYTEYKPVLLTTILKERERWRNDKRTI